MYDEILRNAVNIGKWGKRVNRIMRVQETKNKTFKSRARSTNKVSDEISMFIMVEK